MQNHRVFLIVVLFLAIISACTNQNVKYVPSANPSETIISNMTGTQVSPVAFTPTKSPTPGPSPTSTPDFAHAT
jgi:hypothetical protein